MDKIRLSKIISDLQDRLCISPLSVPSTKNFNDEKPEKTYSIQEKFLMLSENIKNKMVSEETSQKIQQIGKLFNLELLQLADISRAIRGYYFGELKIDDMPFNLAKEIPINLATAQEITKIILEKIINDNSQEKAYQSKLESAVLTVALKNYPEIGEQLITTEKINLMSFPEPVRPSVKNWLADYTYRLGREKHNSIERNNYLFHTDNTQRLSKHDRERLSNILKSYDESAVITVDTERKQIVFLTEQKTNSATKAETQSLKPAQTSSDLSFARTPQSPTNRISFSSPQKLAYEKTARPSQRQAPQPYHITPASNRQRTITKPAQRPLGKNVVDLRDN